MCLARVCKRWSVREMITRSILFSDEIFGSWYFWLMSVSNSGYMVILKRLRGDIWVAHENISSKIGVCLKECLDV